MSPRLHSRTFFTADSSSSGCSAIHAAVAFDPPLPARREYRVTRTHLVNVNFSALREHSWRRPVAAQPELTGAFRSTIKFIRSGTDTFLMMGTALLVSAVVLAVLLGSLTLVRFLALRGNRPGLNETDDWTPGPDTDVKTPLYTSLTPYTRELVTAHLEPGETLVGFARGFFVPPRPKDYRAGNSLAKCPLVVAVTPRRVLLF